LLKVLVTGAAGLIGGEVCAHLAKRGHEVLALTHRTREVRGNDGEMVALADNLLGDVTAPMLGIGQQAFDLVIHCAANLQFDAPEIELQAINVAGTRNALDLARAAGASFLHVSTAYVCGTQEGAIPEGPVQGGAAFTNAYEASKATAERAVENSGLRFAIARPSIVLGDSRTGAIRDFHSLCNVFRLMARGKVTQFPAAPGSTLDLVPIDHVAQGIVQIAERMEQAAGGHYHLVARTPMATAELAHGVARVAHFPDPLVVAPQDYDRDALRPAERLLAERMLTTFGAYFTRSPCFDDRRFRELTGLDCPPTDRDWLDRLIAYGLVRGYLPADPTRNASARRDNNVPAARALPMPRASRP